MEYRYIYYSKTKKYQRVSMILSYAEKTQSPSYILSCSLVLDSKHVPISTAPDPLWLDRKKNPHQAAFRPTVKGTIVPVGQREDANYEDHVAIAKQKSSRPFGESKCKYSDCRGRRVMVIVLNRNSLLARLMYISRTLEHGGVFSPTGSS